MKTLTSIRDSSAHVKATAPYILPSSCTAKLLNRWNHSSVRRNTLIALVLIGVFGAGDAIAPAQTQSTGISSDGNVVTVTVPGGLTTPSLTTNGGGAGTIILQQGASPAVAPQSSIQITVPAAIQAYTLTLPAAGPDASHPALAFGPDGVGYFTSLPAATTVVQPPGVFTGPQLINGGASSIPLVVTSNSINGSSIALDNTSAGGNYTLFYSNYAENAGLWDYTHLRDVLTCTETESAVSCGSTHVISTSGQPQLSSGPGAGSGAQAYFEKANENVPSDQSGVITVLTGSSPSGNAVIATLTFNQPWVRTLASQVQASSYAPACALSPANGATASLTGPNTAFAGPASRSTFDLVSNSSPLAANTAYSWSYKCM